MCSNVSIKLNFTQNPDHRSSTFKSDQVNVDSSDAAPAMHNAKAYDETHENKETEKEPDIQMLLRPRQNLRRCCIPFNFNADIYDDGASIRIWSAIWLGHLLHQVSESARKREWKMPGKMTQMASTMSQVLIQSRFKHCRKELRRRGKYLTRRPGKFWWLSGSCEEKDTRAVWCKNTTLLGHVLLASSIMAQNIDKSCNHATAISPQTSNLNV